MPPSSVGTITQTAREPLRRDSVVTELSRRAGDYMSDMAIAFMHDLKTTMISVVGGSYPRLNDKQNKKGSFLFLFSYVRCNVLVSIVEL